MTQLLNGQLIEYSIPEVWQVAGQQLLCLHAFGNRTNDINIDFNLSNRPQLITDVLVNGCDSKDHAKEIIWSLPVNLRLKALLMLVDENSQKTIMLNYFCEHCQQVMEFSFEISELIKLIDENIKPEIEIVIKDRPLWLKRPCGYHQKEWQAKEFNSEQAATMSIIQSLSVKKIPEQFWDESVDNELVAKIEAAMDEFDPIINYSIKTTCPFCEQEQQINIDWELECLNLLKRKQQVLLRAVHQLARHYNWSEKEIVSLPEWRRRHYLSLINTGRK